VKHRFLIPIRQIFDLVFSNGAECLLNSYTFQKIIEQNKKCEFAVSLILFAAAFYYSITHSL